MFFKIAMTLWMLCQDGGNPSPKDPEALPKDFLVGGDVKVELLQPLSEYFWVEGLIPRATFSGDGRTCLFFARDPVDPKRPVASLWEEGGKGIRGLGPVSMMSLLDLHSARISPDGKRFALLPEGKDRDSWGAAIVGLDGTSTPVPADGWVASCGFAGEHLVFLELSKEDGNVRLKSWDGKKATIVDEGAKPGMPCSLRISPDSSKAAWLGTAGENHQGISDHRIRVVDLKTGKAFESVPFPTGCDVYRGDYFPTLLWDSHGEGLYCNRFPGGERDHSEVCRFDLKSRKVEPLFKEKGNLVLGQSGTDRLLLGTPEGGVVYSPADGRRLRLPPRCGILGGMGEHAVLLGAAGGEHLMVPFFFIAKLITPK